MLELDQWPVDVVQDVDKLMEYVGPFAHEMVQRDGAVIPCGAGLSGQGQLEPFVVDVAGFSSMTAAYEFLFASVVDNRDSWRAVCLAVAVVDEDQENALRFIVEHVSGYCAVGVMVFHLTRFVRVAVFEDLVWMPIPPMVWAQGKA